MRNQCIVLVIASLCWCTYAATHECPKNEEYVDCVNCTFDCSEGIDCKDTRPCKPGCYCNPDRFRVHNGSCIPVEECVSKIPCPPNESFHPCHSCEVPCGVIQDSIPCSRKCRTGCYCDPAYYRRDNQGKCVPKTECPTGSKLKKPVCSENEVYSRCRANCELQCGENKEKLLGCRNQCHAGCQCGPKYFRRLNGTCVLKGECPNYCPENEVFEKCHGCEVPCGKEADEVMCAKVCYTGCFCDPSKYRKNMDGKCIPKDDCPPNEIE